MCASWYDVNLLSCEIERHLTANDAMGTYAWSTLNLMMINYNEYIGPCNVKNIGWSLAEMSEAELIFSCLSPNLVSDCFLNFSSWKAAKVVKIWVHLF